MVFQRHLLKSLRSVQISILKPKKYPQVLRIYQYCEKNLGTLTSKSFFRVKFGVVWQRYQICYSIGIVDDFRIIEKLKNLLTDL